jgi:xylan 1,4-beta-xylosidase
MMSCCTGVRWLAAFAVCALPACTAVAQSIAIDASRVTGTIRRLNDVDNGPLCQHGVVDLTRYYRELGVQNVRLHDVSWSYGDVLDMEFLFPDWNADPERAESYNFAASDLYVKTITDLGINIIFRLGYSAEGKSAIRHNAPPPDYQKWAAVVEHIVRHYNEGWDNGLHANIRYWEVWNEPDIADFWSGTPEQYYRLYEVTVRALKRVDPTLRVGGPALAGHEPFLDGFLAYARQRALPLDFLSWHIYTQDPADVAKRAERFHEMLTRYGYAGAQSVLDEWNYGPSNWGALFHDASATQTYFDSTQNSVGAAFDAAVLIAMEDAPVDIATFYTGTTAMWGLFTAAGVPQKPYYAFLAFTELLESPKRLAVSTAGDSPIRTLAGISADGRTIRILLSNPSDQAHALRLMFTNLPWSGAAEYKEQVIDERSNLEARSAPVTRAGSDFSEVMAGESVVLLTVRVAGK